LDQRKKKLISHEYNTQVKSAKENNKTGKAWSSGWECGFTWGDEKMVGE
jgi:hypothetical protein